ncbi:hypothetical protein [Streptomyces atriruber]|uniref:hypothetical protein n=1 Tax=Streptomyces atriruber TaxID=545121 RepID=UPI0006E21AE1|nr:hypothetical protein [Streptomyces atriruber]
MSEYREFELHRRRTRWWGRRRWDCLLVNEDRYLGWGYRRRRDAEAHVATCRAFENNLRLIDQRYPR